MHDECRLSVDEVDYSPMVAEAPEGKNQICLNVDKSNSYRKTILNFCEP